MRLGVMAALLTLYGVPAAAQMLQSTDRAFAALNFGTQTKARTFTNSGSLPLYDETATYESSVAIGSSSIVDLHAGARVWRNVGVGLGWSSYSDTSAGTLSASVPDPLFFDTFVTRTATAENLKHEEKQVRLSVFWLQPVTDKFDVAVYAGPTFFSIKRPLVTGFAVTTGGTTIASVTQSTVDESATALHFGFDLRYLIIKNAGVGVFARYSSASIDSTLVDGGKIEMGGLNYGLGLRFRF